MTARRRRKGSRRRKRERGKAASEGGKEWEEAPFSLPLFAYLEEGGGGEGKGLRKGL